MIKVLHINLHNQTWGMGSEARLLHESLPTLGIASELWASRIKATKTGFHIRQLVKQSEGVQSTFTREDLMQIFAQTDLTQVDVIHFHLTKDYFSPLVLPFFQIKPVVLSIYDSSLYTAGCMHSAHCQQWVDKQCTNCPLYHNDVQAQEHQTQLFSLKEDLYKSQKLHIVYYHDWQYEQLRKSMLKGQSFTKLPKLHQTDAFYIGDKGAARQNLGLSSSNLMLLLHGDEQLELSKRYFTLAKAGIDHLRQNGYKVTIVYCGKELLPNDLADEVRNIDWDVSPFLLGEYYRAADLNLYFHGLDQSYAILEESMACGLPSLAFAIGSVHDVIEADQTGLLIPPFDIVALHKCLDQFFGDAQFREQIKSRIIKQQVTNDVSNRIFSYVKFYEQVTQKQAGMVSQAAIGQTQVSTDKISVEHLLQSGIDAVDSYIQKQQVGFEKKNEKNTFIDRFFSEVFRNVDIKTDKTAIWQMVKLWFKYRNITGQMAFSNFEERNMHLQLLDTLRNRLTEYFKVTSLDEFKSVDVHYNNTISQLWRFVFLNVTSVLHADTKEYTCPESILQEERQTGYPYFFVKMMYYPYVDKSYDLDIHAIIHANLPLSFKIILMSWLTTAPLYSGTQFHRQHVLKYIASISKNMAKDLKILSPDLCILFIEHFVMALWRVSYLGGNNIEALREYGKFIRANVKYRFPKFCVPIRPKKHKNGDKMRIGYISMNFRNQAVSQYMANRLIYHDKNKFWIKTFILKRHSDAMTETIKKHSDEWQEFDNLLDFQAIAEQVKKSKLDMLIFADVGMDLLTYTLASMNLAPKQAVLVGHGTTTGLTTLDYYISGDHEPDHAQEHYTEKLICLPNAGVAQLAPSQNESKMTRADIGVPADAVMFISCANGIKHYYDRDELMIEILQKAPNAYIVLKPFQSPNAVDFKFMDRIKEKAKAAGVEERLIQLPPLPNPGDLMGLIVLADVQLDTYPYGGWTTNLEALYYNLPIVTQVGDMARNRWGARLLRCLGIEAGIANNAHEYVEWAVRFAKDTSLRIKITDEIKEKAKDVLFNGKAAQPAYEEMLVKMITEKKRVIK